MSTDKLADALSDALETMDVDGMAAVYADGVADYLRSPEGIHELWRDPVIRYHMVEKTKRMQDWDGGGLLDD